LGHHGAGDAHKRANSFSPGFSLAASAAGAQESASNGTEQKDNFRIPKLITASRFPLRTLYNPPEGLAGRAELHELQEQQEKQQQQQQQQ